MIPADFLWSVAASASATLWLAGWALQLHAGAGLLLYLLPASIGRRAAPAVVRLERFLCGFLLTQIGLQAGSVLLDMKGP